MPALFDARSFLDMVAANPNGWGNAPPAPQPPWKRDPWMYQGDIRNLPERPRDYMTPVAETVSPFVPVPGLGAAEGLVSTALTRAPWLTGALAGAATYATPGFAGGEEERDRVKDLQQKLRDAGYYSGKIDGVMGDGTRAAKERFEAAEMQRGQLAAQRSAAEAAKAESERKRMEMEQRARERQAGEDRMREMEGNVPLFSRVLRDYGPALGMGAGLGVGALTRGKIRSGMETKSAAAAREAEGIINAVTPRTDWQGRVGAVNEFWQKGGAGERVPFLTAPRGKLGFKSNPDAAEAASLYAQPGPIRAADVGAMGAFGAEAGISHHMATDAQRRVEEAQARVSADPSEANIQALQVAINQATIFEAMSRIGLGAAAGYGGMLAKSPTNYSRPSTAGAEAARLRINERLAPKSRTRSGK